METAIVTGSSGFIGYHTAKRLLTDGYRVVGVDSLNDYYDVSLKRARQEKLLDLDDFSVENRAIEDEGYLADLFAREKPQVVVHLAAQAGVRFSIESPRNYFDSNLKGTFELLEAGRAHPPRHMLFASTSSAYGANTVMPYHERMQTDHQMSFYAATKKATESMAHSYAHLFDLPITMFRFFTVYGPWGRPDMALFKFTKAILEDRPIDVFNHGEMSRDFTYVHDLVKAIGLLVDAIPTRGEAENSPGELDSLSPVAPWRIVNVGNSEAVPLVEFIEAIEDVIGKKAQRNLLPMQAGDVPATWADASLLQSLTGYKPQTKMKDGVAAFVDWYRTYYQV